MDSRKKSPAQKHVLTQSIFYRPRIHRLLSTILDHSACWISAPSGGGKTLSVIDYIRTRKLNSVWYRVDNSDSDIAVFYKRLSQTTQLHHQSKLLPVFEPEHSKQPKAFARIFFRQMYALLPPGTVIVFDDLHNSNTTVFHETLLAALEELPNEISCICLSHCAPGKELLSLRLKSDIKIINSFELAFTKSEIEDYLAFESIESSFADDIYRCTKGWPAGVALLIAEVQSTYGPPTNKSWQSTVVSQTALFTLIAERLFSEFDFRHRECLVKTSLLREISADVVNEVLECTDTSVLLSELSRHHWVISQSPDCSNIYVCHDLFREFLRVKLASYLSADALDELQKKTINILIKHGLIDSAIDLALETQQWGCAERIILNYAESTLLAGHAVSLMRWIDALPEKQSRLSPWLCYWAGKARFEQDDEDADLWFERAYLKFIDEQNTQGIGLTAAAAILFAYRDWNHTKCLQLWVTRGFEAFADGIKFVQDAQELQFTSAILRALHITGWQKLKFEKIRALAEYVLELIVKLKEISDPNQLIQASQILIIYSTNYKNSQFVETIVNVISSLMDDPRVKLSVRARWLSTYGWCSTLLKINPTLFYPSGADALNEAAKIAIKNRLRLVEFHCWYALSWLAILRNHSADISILARKLGKLVNRKSIDQMRKWRVTQAWAASAQGRYDEAMRFALMLNLDPEEGITPLNGVFVTTYFQICIVTSRFAEARAILQSCHESDNELGKKAQLYRSLVMVLEKKAAAASDYKRALQDFFRIARREHFTTFLGCVPLLAAELLADALQYEIEEDFCTQIIRRRQLKPPSLHLPYWPWAVKIFALGKLRIEIEGIPITFGQKAQRKPIEILQALIIAGEPGVEVKHAMRELWTGAASSMSKKAFEINVHRLRRLLGNDEAVLIGGGRIKLNPSKVWVDVQSFEYRLDVAQRQLDQSGLRDGAQYLAEEVLISYRGRFFEKEIHSKQKQSVCERIEGKLIQVIASLGRYYEAKQNWSEAIRVYQHGLMHENSIEQFYRGQIRCYLALGEVAAAWQVYRRCREIFSALMGKVPSQETQALLMAGAKHHAHFVELKID